MEQYKQEFIEFMIDCNVLKFGDFVTKSGRKTPFFVNTGFYRTGAQLRKLGQYYAKAIESKFGLDFDVLFGPAYKGICLLYTSPECVKQTVSPTRNTGMISVHLSNMAALRTASSQIR